MSDLIRTAKCIQHAKTGKDALYLIGLCEKTYNQFQLNFIRKLLASGTIK